MDNRKYSVYKITGPTGRVYVGFTIRALRERWYSHLQNSEEQNTHPLSCDIRKYSKDSFTIELIVNADTKQEAGILETFWIEKLNSSNPEFGYNSSSGGLTPKFTDIFKQKLKSIHNTPVVNSKHSEASKKRYEDPQQRLNAREINKRTLQNPIHRANHQAACAAAQSREDVKEKHRITQKRIKNMPEERARMSRIAKISHNTPQAKLNHSVASRRNWGNPEFRAKHAAGLLRRSEAKRKKQENL